MAEVCSSFESTGRTAVSSCPLNLSLLSKKRCMDELDDNGSNPEYDHRKRPKHEGDNSDDERPQIIEDRDRYYQHENGEGEVSKSSILQHFHSFIRRKTDVEEEVINHPAEETPEHGERNKKSPTMADFTPVSAFDRYKPHNSNPNSSERLPITPERGIIDYNTVLSHQLATRPTGPNFMDIWSVVAASAMARAKFNGVDGKRNSPPYPTLPGMRNDEERKHNFRTSPAPPQPNSIPERTMRQNNWAVKVWRDWAIEKNSHANLKGKSGPYDIVPLDIKDASVEIMSYWLPRFITEVRRRDKRPYPPDTLMQIASGLQRHLRHVSGRSDITFFDKYSPTFAEFREALKARSDAINSELSTARRDMNHSLSPQSNDGCGDSWTSSLFNLNTAKGLFRAIFYYNCINFHITSMEEHHSLLVSQFHVGYDEKTSQEYLEFTRDNGETTRKFAAPYDPRCLVKVFKKYFKCIPSTGLLYKRPLQSSDSTELRFSFNPVGINKLRETFKVLFGGRRTGTQLPALEDEEEKGGHSPPPYRCNSSEDDSTRRMMKYNHSPRSNASSGRASLSDFKEHSGEENRRPSDSSAPGDMSPVRGVISYAFERSEKSHSPENDIVTMPRQKILEENNNNNSSTAEDENCLTLKVPVYVKSVVILQGGKRFRVDLTGMN